MQGIGKIQHLDSSVSLRKLDSSTNLLQSDINTASKEQLRNVSFLQMFRFANSRDCLLIAIGCIFALINGASMPIFALLWGNMIDRFQGTDNLVDQTFDLLKTFIYISLGVFASGCVMIATWLISGERQSTQCRKRYLKALLSQQIGWFDNINQSELSSQFSADTAAFQGAIGDKTSLMISTFSMGATGIAVSFSKGWLLALVVGSMLPIIIGCFMLYTYMATVSEQNEKKVYTKAGGQAEQALSSIKTVKMLNGEKYESANYTKLLDLTVKGIKRFGIMYGIGLGGTFFAMFCGYSIGFWYGSHCLLHTQKCPTSLSSQQYTSGGIFTIVFAMIIIGLNMSQVPNCLKKIKQGKIAAARIYSVIDRKPLIMSPENGVKIQNLQGIFQFKNVVFCYPKDKSKRILNGLNLVFTKNKIGLVGQSGCGKSTVLQLIMRFYDPDYGQITLDGHDLRTIDLNWLRNTIGYVGQEPVLFNLTIKQNLLVAKQNATDEELMQALKKAQAYDFVCQLNQQMNTRVGFAGGQISGGQKQRIAIARAVLRDPKILILDEATSALDRKNEKLIQATLNKISQGRITITIAHRVKTIMSSEQIFVIQKGEIKQYGKFSQLKRFQNFNAQDQCQQNPEIQDRKDQKIEQKPQIQKSKRQKINQQKEQMTQIYKQNSYGRILSYTKGNYILIFFGLLSSVVLGCLYPVVTVFVAKMIKTMLIKKDVMSEAEQKGLIFLLLGITSLIAAVFQNLIFTIVGVKVTTKIRSQVFYKLMKLPIVWHQRQTNSIGSITSQLENGCRQVKEMSTSYIYGIVQHLSCIVAAIVIAFMHDWRTALVSLGFFPIMIGAGVVRAKFRAGSAIQSQRIYEKSNNIIVQSMVNIRTVRSLGYQQKLYQTYRSQMKHIIKQSAKNGVISGFFYGLSQLVIFTTVPLMFYISSLFVQNNGVSIDDMFTGIFALFFAAMTIGNNSHMMPDMAECRIAAGKLFLLLDSQDQQQKQQQQNSKMLKNPIRGQIQFKNISFKYESRNEYLFKNFSLKIPHGQKIAFVGSSGCGKSSLFGFILRFYEPQNGQIILNGIDIKDYDIHFLRSQFGVVGQQPVLFNASFAQNIKYNMQNATYQQIVAASLQAHAYDFIIGQQLTNIRLSRGSSVQQIRNSLKNSSLQNGFNRSVGIKGSHISGGQKQRLAIARTILRKPQILLLDQATSALDSINQMRVQEALDQIMVNKSSINVAHRLDTIKNSKLIYVFQKGKVVQCGNYQQLINAKGYFYHLQKGTIFAGETQNSAI